MSSEVVFIRELPVAQLALVVLVSPVDHPVLLHVVASLETLPADITAEGSLPSVLQAVSLQFDQLGEGLVAVRALVGPLLGVGRPHVVGQVAARLEHFITETTVQSGSAVSTGDMIPGGEISVNVSHFNLNHWKILYIENFIHLIFLA